MISALIAFAAMAAPQAGVQVDVGRANWSSYPALVRAHRPFPTEPMVDFVSEVLRERQCSFENQTDRTFDITVPYLALVNPDGSVSRVVVGDTGCRSIRSPGSPYAFDITPSDSAVAERSAA